ncbi:MAG: GNAT family N-acetyltransferase [Leptolyngbya sp. SIO4C5]|nr:GNAT family N-acetyltransferase [Leptolyngbya sp. SIO4C5]
MKQPELPREYHLRRAIAADMGAIRWLVLRSLLDPTQLRWQQFWLIEQQRQVVACGQLRQFEQAQELGSLVVDPAHRRLGLGTHLTQHLIQQANQPLYLECLGDRLGHFYQRLGFVTASWETMPAAIQRKFRLSRWAARWLNLPLQILEYPQQK